MQANVTAFLTVMAALSATTQALVELIKKRVKWLNEKDTPHEQDRVLVLHLLALGCGSGLTLLGGLTPLQYFGMTDKVVNVIGAGFLVSFGGGLFNDLLGVLRQLKDAQAALKRERLARADAYRSRRVAPPVGV